MLFFGTGVLVFRTLLTLGFFVGLLQFQFGFSQCGDHLSNEISFVIGSMAHTSTTRFGKHTAVVLELTEGQGQNKPHQKGIGGQPLNYICIYIYIYIYIYSSIGEHMCANTLSKYVESR